MNPVLAGIERTTLRAPLGVGFWDAVEGNLVRDGLVVTRRPAHVTEREATGLVSPGGIHVFHHLPGLTARSIFEHEAIPSGTRRFAFEVDDARNHFHPFWFEADCPADGLFVPNCLHGSPPETRYLPLFSTATRPAPPGKARLRMNLVDVATGRPAAWAMVHVEYGGQELAAGLSGIDGALHVIFNYPEPPIASPPSAFPWHWRIRLRAEYATPAQGAPTIPSLCYVISQPPARLLTDTSASVELVESDLEFGRELVVTSEAKSHVLIEQA